VADTNGSVCTIQRLAGTNKFSVVSLRTSGDCGKFRREERVIWCMGAEEFLSCTCREFFLGGGARSAGHVNVPDVGLRQRLRS